MTTPTNATTVAEDTSTPPVADIVPHTTAHHGRTLVDNYAWLQKKDDPAVIAYLEAENAYARTALRHTEPLQEQLFGEMRGCSACSTAASPTPSPTSAAAASWGGPGTSRGLMHKQNTFIDFIACAEHLIAAGYTAPTRLAIMGGSAGGLLMGAVANMRPDLFGAVVALVPFTNVITAMLMPDLPLTVIEYEQWGNPADAEAFAYMLSYSPYENVAAKAYPPILVKAGLNDLQVPYWDPAKWVARLRAHKTDANRLLLITNMEAGHSGASGRYDHLREEAQIYAFLIDTLHGV